MVEKVILVSFDAGSYTATVRPYGSLSVHLSGIPVSRAIPPSEMVAGRYCAILAFDEGNPVDSVVAAVFTP